MIDRYGVRRAEQRAAKDADQAEKVAVRTGSAVLDIGIRDDLIADAVELEEFDPELVGLDDENPGFTRWHRQDLGVEGEADPLHQEVVRRIKYLGSSYPFRLEGANLVYTGLSSGMYEYCLGISLAPNITTGRFVELPRSFERIVATVTRLYMGVHAEHLHTGAPRDPGFGEWPSIMRHLHDRSGEWWWRPQEGYTEDPHVGGDQGIDFVVWKRALDPRPGSLFVIGQCACGDDWDDKLNDLDLKQLGAWFHPVSWIDPIRAFATPFCLSDGNFQFAHTRAGWVLDRVRLTAMAEVVREHDDYVPWMPKVGEMIELSFEEAA